MIISITTAIKQLKRDKIVALPSETVYGLAGNAKSRKVVMSIFKAKNRPADNPLIVHFKDKTSMLAEVAYVPHYLDQLINSFSPGPVTYILKLKPDSKLKASTLGKESIACRIPSNKDFLSILNSIDFPICAPSANTSGKPSGTNALMVANDLGDKIAGVVDGGPSDIGLESTIIDCREPNSITILRSGVIGKEEIRKVFQSLHIIENSKSKDVVPGNKYRHYSPNTPIYEINSTENLKKSDSIICCLEEYFPLKRSGFSELIIIGSRFNSNHIARKLYDKINSIDSLKTSKVYWKSFEYQGKTSVKESLANRLKKILKQNS